MSADAAAQLAQLLAALTHPDTNAIREAEVALKPLLKDGRSVPALVEVLKSRGTQVCFMHLAGHLKYGISYAALIDFFAA